MNSFTDYYALLGVAIDAPSAEIKAAFKKLALRYHPDVYKGDDAHERMRVILQAYQTLSNPEKRRNYDAQRSEYILHKQGGGQSAAERVHARGMHREQRVRREGSKQSAARDSNGRLRVEVSPGARRDRFRYYDFPVFHEKSSMLVDLVDITYTLPAQKAQALVEQGMLRGVAPEVASHVYYCHRCHYRWDVEPSHQRLEQRHVPRHCPRCFADDWIDYLLLHCAHCQAIFESEQVRYQIGAFAYGKRRSSDTGALCPPYELFPLCPYCGKARWCPAEEQRVSEMRQHLEQRETFFRVALVAVVVLVIVVVGLMAWSLLL